METRLIKILLVFFLTFSLAGCTIIFQKGRRSDIQKIEDLSRQVDELTQAKNILEERLQQEIKDKQVSLKMMEKGLVITFVDDVLFDSGKAVVRPEAYTMLDKVAKVLQENVADLDVGIEGHTDNQPIHFSARQWKSNWELSTARALSVLHYLSENEGVSPARLSAIGYGEYRPVASNDSKQGRQANRRVEIVILPKITKAKDAKQPAEPVLAEPEENLK